MSKNICAHQWTRSGKGWSGNRKVQLWRCNKCGTRTTRPPVTRVATGTATSPAEPE